MLLPFWVSLLLTICLAPVPAPPLAQAPDTLIVTLHDAAGIPVPGVLVLVRDLGGAMELGRATTDASGQATFATLPASDVRVLVQGALLDGTPLRLPGEDARGVRCLLGLPPARLELRATPEGLVSPDPATMIARDPGAPYRDDPVLLFPTLVPAPSAAPATAIVVPTALVVAEAAAPAPAPRAIAPLASIVIAIGPALVAATALALVISRRRP